MTHLLVAIGTPFIPSWDAPGYALRPFAGELWLIAAIVAVLLTPFFVKRSNAPTAFVALAGLTVALISVLFVVPAEGGLQFRGLLVSDHVAVFWKALLYLFAIGIVLMWFATTGPSMHEGDGPEFFTLLLGATLGMSFMASTSNLLMLFLAVELASLPSYVLAGFRKTNRVGAEASLKYVLFGAASSAIMVYGLSLLYGLFGTLQLTELAPRLAESSSPLLVVAVFGLVVGLGFKLSAVPFHFWCPDVFEGASVDVSAFLSVASKGAALVLFLRATLTIASGYGYQPDAGLIALAATIGTIGAVTCTVGNTAAFVQNNIKRLLAYSSIAHAGYMLCAVSLLLKTDRSVEGFDPAGAATQAILVYLAVYLFMNLGAFTVAGMVYQATGRETLDAFRGLGRRAPILAGAMFCCLVSLIGLPPFAGFAAKLNVMWVLFQGGGWWWALIVVIGVNTILSAFYYFRVVRAMYLEPSDEPAFLGNPVGLAVSVGSAAVLFFMLILFGPLSRLTTDYSRWADLPPAGIETVTTSTGVEVPRVASK